MKMLGLLLVLALLMIVALSVSADPGDGGTNPTPTPTTAPTIVCLAGEDTCVWPTATIAPYPAPIVEPTIAPYPAPVSPITKAGVKSATKKYASKK